MIVLQTAINKFKIPFNNLIGRRVQYRYHAKSGVLQGKITNKNGECLEVTLDNGHVLLRQSVAFYLI